MGLVDTDYRYSWMKTIGQDNGVLIIGLRILGHSRKIQRKINLS